LPSISGTNQTVDQEVRKKSPGVTALRNRAQKKEGKKIEIEYEK